MALVTLQDVSLSYGSDPVLDAVSLRIEPGERVCLVGRNGEGKSSLMKIVAGEVVPDRGQVIRQPQVRIARLAQEEGGAWQGTNYDVVAGGLGGMMDLLARHHGLLVRLAQEGGDSLLAELAEVEQEMETTGAWNFQQRIDTVLSRLQLDPDQAFAQLSGGMQRRVLLARALVSGPDLLLLDEPTNHLDVETIVWLEEFLLANGPTLLFVTHDRAFLQRLATRILDLDRGRVTSWPGSYDTYLQRKEALLVAESAQQAEFDRKLAQEEAWLRQGIKARRTRNEGRVRELVIMRQERQARREQLGRVRLEIGAAALSGKVVALLKDVSLAFAGKEVIRNLTTTVLRGDKVGIIGPNGAGKTTLLKLLLGELEPDTGQVRLGTNLQPAYFDQQRAQLDPEKSLFDNLGDGREFVEVGGRQRHLIGYLRDFLFPPDRVRAPVKVLSGGERNRLLLAKLFARPANILVLDEPTNDLDVETLELLEERLLQYPGTVLLVSHDRAFLNNVVTSSLVFEGEGRVREYAGGYDDWLRQRVPVTPIATAAEKKGPKRARSKKGGAGVRKLTYRESGELEGLPGMIESLETEQETLYNAMADPAFYQEGGDAIPRARARLAEVEQELVAAYDRWEELEAVQARYLAAKGK